MPKQADESGGVLGIFPALGTVGGIQASGRIAWEAVCHDSRLETRQKQLFCYDPFAEYDWDGEVGRVRVASSHLKALWAAYSLPGEKHNILIWHISLLRFLPFLRCSSPRIALFLHGIESWHTQPFWIRHWLPRVSLFLSNSQFTWDKFQSYNSLPKAVKYQRVSLGLGDKFIESTPRPAEKPIALMVGRLMRSEDYKGHREVISAWPGVLREIPEAMLWIVGDGDLRPELEAMAKACGVSDKVRFWGRVSEAEKAELLKQARCLALPSRGEGFGLVYLEAMRLGRPCLVSDLDAASEVINPPEAGLAINPNDKEALTRAICRLLGDTPEWAVWSCQARQRYETHFTSGSFQDRLVTSLLECWS